MSTVSIARLVVEGIVDEEEVAKFVKNFGHYLDLTPESVAIFANKVSSWDTLMEFLNDADCLYDLDEPVLMDLARSIGAAFCAPEDNFNRMTGRLVVLRRPVSKDRLDAFFDRNDFKKCAPFEICCMAASTAQKFMAPPWMEDDDALVARSREEL